MGQNKSKSQSKNWSSGMVGRKREWSEAEIAQIKDMYEVQGKSPAAIAKIMGEQTTTLYRTVEHLNLKKAPAKPRVIPDLPPETKALRAKIKDMWTKGKSVRQMAVILAASEAKPLSRSAIMGHVHRMDLPHRSPDSKRQQAQKPKPFNIPPQNGLGGPKGVKTGPKLTEIKNNGAPEPIGLVADFPDRERSTCRYIHGDVSSSKWTLCGHPGYPWCDHHAKRFTTPITNRSNIDPVKVRNSGIGRALG
jgi:hypothetical protein